MDTPAHDPIAGELRACLAMITADVAKVCACSHGEDSPRTVRQRIKELRWDVREFLEVLDALEEAVLQEADTAGVR